MRWRLSGQDAPDPDRDRRCEVGVSRLKLGMLGTFNTWGLLASQCLRPMTFARLVLPVTEIRKFGDRDTRDGKCAFWKVSYLGHVQLIFTGTS
jgi:hypothetical protein